MRGRVVDREFALRIVWTPIVAAMLWLTGAGTPCPGEEYASEQAIKNAIQKAKTYLMKRAATGHSPQGAVGVVALLKAGVPPTDPVVLNAIEGIKKRCEGGEFKSQTLHTGTYEATVYIMVLANSDADQYKDEIQLLANWLMSWQRTSGGWDYPSEPGPDKDGDTSQTQYAMLGLWEASMAGATVNLAAFDKCARWHVTRQLGDGAFAYRAGVSGHDNASLSMTAAGLGSVQICRMFLFPSTKDEKILVEGDEEAEKKKREENRKKFGVLEDPDKVKQELENAPAQKGSSRFARTVGAPALTKSIGGGLQWLDQNFAVRHPTGWTMYYLYSLERAMALANIDGNLGSHDWYLEGASYLVKTQEPAGNWASNNSGYIAGTAFGLMFLTRATHKTLGRRHNHPKIGGGLLAGGRGLPTDLSTATTVDGAVKKRKMSGPVDDLLAVLEDPRNANFFNAQEALVEKVVLEDPKALVGKTDRLLKLATVKNDEVRRTAMWALGRSQDITVVPTLIEGLNDPNLDTMVEARNALRFLSKRIDGFGLPGQPSDQERKQAVERWKKWYFTVRPYDERDSLSVSD